MTKQEKIEAQMINDVIENFDFFRCHFVMKFLNWRWVHNNNQVPTIDELKSATITILSVVASSPNVINPPPNEILPATVAFPVKFKLDAEILPTKFMLPFTGAFSGNSVYSITLADELEPLPN